MSPYTIKILAIFLLAWLLETSILFVQQPIQFTYDNGLPSNTVYRVYEDKQGFIWILTDNGLVKFDGNQFKVFNTSAGMPINDVWEIRFADKDKLYFFGKNPVLGYIKNDSIHLLSSQNAVDGVYLSQINDQIFARTSIPGNIAGISEDSTTWQSKTQWTDYQNNQKPKNLFSAFSPDFTSNFIVYPNYLIQYNQDWSKIDSISFSKPLPFKRRQWYTTYDSLQFTIFNQGVAILNTKTKLLKSYTTKDLGFPEFENEVRVHKAKNGFQLTSKGGISYFDTKGNFVHTVPISYPEFIHHFEDSNGNIWSNSLTKGLKLTSKKKYRTILSKNFVEQIEFHEGSLYAGIRQNGLYRYSKTGEWQLVQAMKDYRFDGQKKLPIYNTQLEHQSNDFIYSNENGHFNISSKGSKQIQFPIQSDSIDLASFELFRLKKEGDQYFFLERNFFGTSKQSQLNQNIRWIATPKLQIIDRFTLSGEVYYLAKHSLDKLSNGQFQTVLGFYHFKNNLIDVKTYGSVALIGTGGNGVFTFDGKRAEQIPATKGLTINQMMLNYNKLWLATTTGVFCLRINSKNATNSKIVDEFYTEDGLQMNNVTDLAIQDSTLYVSSSKGIVALDLHNKFINKPPNLFINPINQENANQKKAIISFGAIDFFNQNQLKFKYRLLPVDTAWNSTASRIVEFPNLPPNTYHFELKARDQHYNESLLTRSFTIQPKFYQRDVAYLVYFSLLVGAIAGIIRLVDVRYKQITNKKLIQQRRLSELQLSAIRSQLNPHFIFNSLNSIQYFIEDNQADRSQKYLSKFAALMRQFLNNSRLEQILIEQEIDFLDHYLSLEKMRFEKGCNYVIECSPELIEDEIKIPSLLIQPFLENSINHGIFHSVEEGLVSILIHKMNDENDVQIEIIDNGVGIEECEQSIVKDQSKRGVRSINLIKERIELLNKKGICTVDIQMENLKTTAGTSGTKVTITITDNQANKHASE